MASKRKSDWSRISLSTDGKVILVRYTDIDIKTLSNLLYALLKEIPHAPKVMQFVIEQYNKDHEV